jgi:hypothetical protein
MTIMYRCDNCDHLLAGAALPTVTYQVHQADWVGREDDVVFPVEHLCIFCASGREGPLDLLKGRKEIAKPFEDN